MIKNKLEVGKDYVTLLKQKMNRKNVKTWNFWSQNTKLILFEQNPEQQLNFEPNFLKHNNFTRKQENQKFVRFFKKKSR